MISTKLHKSSNEVPVKKYVYPEICDIIEVCAYKQNKSNGTIKRHGSDAAVFSMPIDEIPINIWCICTV